MNGFFTLIVVAGSFLEVTGMDTESIRYDNLTWEESTKLAELSFRQGHEIVIWRMESEEE